MNIISIEREARRENLPDLFVFVEETLVGLAIPQENREKMMMALDEALTNVVLYAYLDDQRGTVAVRIFRDGNSVTAEIVDHGRPFDPTTHPVPDTSLPIEQRPIGGLGIHLMRELLTGMKYFREKGMNRLVLTSIWEK